MAFMAKEPEMKSGATKPAAAGGCASWPQTPDEFEKLVDAYLGRLLAYASRRLRDVQEAEDVVQEVFVRAYVERANHRNVLEVGAYLYRMTSNACADVLRKRRRFPRLRLVPRFGDPQSGPASPDRGPAEASCDAEQAARVDQLLRRLPKKQAEAVRLRVFGGLSLSEIALISGCSIHTVSSRLRYGFGKLRRIVKKDRPI